MSTGFRAHVCRTHAVRLGSRRRKEETNMARRIRDSKLDTRSARARLKQRREPYWASMSGGLALGYRKGATGGTWIAKRYSAEHGRKLHAIGTADDILDVDGKTVFSFDQAQARARDWLAKQVKQDRGEVAEDKGPYTVAKAMEAYFEFLESDGRPKHTIRDARYRDSAFIRYKFDDVDIAALTSKRLRRWRDDLATAAPRLRTRKGESQKHRKMADNEDARRARRASANRTWTILRAALNHAFEKPLLPAGRDSRTFPATGNSANGGSGGSQPALLAPGPCGPLNAQNT